MSVKLQISSENSEYQIIESLKNSRSKRSKTGEAFVEGIESIKQAFNAGLSFTRIVYSSDTKLSDWAMDFMERAGSEKIIEVSGPLFKRLCDKGTPSELIITVRIKKIFLEDVNPPESPFYLVFDRPSDLGNFGTIVRTANSFQVDGILILGHSIDVFDPKVIRSSLGSIFFTPIIQTGSFDSFAAWVSDMKEKSGMLLVGSDSTGEVSLHSHGIKKPVAFVLGNEAKGMSIALQQLCDTIIKIPNKGNINSLNVSCAGSIVLWEIFRNSL